MVRPVKNVEIEYLRAVAVTLVIAQHLATLLYWTPPWLAWFFKYARTYTGVDLFFCISGYVIGSSLLRELDTAEGKTGAEIWIHFKAFWIRRAFRILPSAWLWIVFALLASLFLHRFGFFGPFWVNWKITLSIILFVFNDYYLHVVNDLHQLVPDNLGPYWSLSLEEQFYFVFPFLLFFIRNRARLLGSLLFLIAVQFFLDRNTPMGNALWPNRLDTLMWGVVIAFFQRTTYYRLFEPVSLRVKAIGGTVSVLLIVLIGLVVEALHELSMANGILSILCAVLVWLASYSKKYVLPVGRSVGRTLEWIGSRSYTLYLVHMPAYMLARTLWVALTDVSISSDSRKTFTIPMILTALLLMGLLTELSYRLVERPLRNRGRILSETYLQKAQRELATPGTVQEAESARNRS